MESRQVRRAEERHAAKVASSVERKLKYPASVYRPPALSGEYYAANGAREMARRRSDA